jgi:hypothetical protein|tara:strand:- start:1608 stop:2210 length:603 start_codon:yes stop_codon:yes gene_type:complete
MKIANIVYTRKFECPDNINIVKTFEEADKRLPTLVIGWKAAKEVIGEEFDITEKVYNDRLHWTFAMTENRNEFEHDIPEFIKYAHQYLVKDISYQLVDPIQEKDEFISRTVKSISNIKKLTGYIHKNGMIYIYGNETIFGFDLKFYKFKYGSAKKTKEHLESAIGCSLLDSNILIDYKDDLENLDNGIRYLPYLYYLKNG